MKSRHLSGLVFFLVFLVALTSACDWFADLFAQLGAPDIEDNPGDTLLVKTNPASYRITARVTLTNNNLSLSGVTVLLPVPQSNPYQEISGVEPGDAVIGNIPGTSDKTARFTITENPPASGESISFAISYNAVIYDIQTDFTRIGSIMPYDTSSDIYRNYLGNSGDIINLENSTLQSVADSLWSQSADELDYAYHCYDYIEDHFSYALVDGILTTDQLFLNWAGECGDLSTAFVALLRRKGIPARHLVAIRPTTNPADLYHAWADFYLEGYGWIPVDVTYAVNSSGEPAYTYFGKVGVAGNGIIMTKGVNLAVNNGMDETTISLLQNFAYWYWGTGSGNLTYNFSFLVE